MSVVVADAVFGVLLNVMVADKSPLSETEARWLSQVGVGHPALTSVPEKMRQKRFRFQLKWALDPKLSFENLLPLYARQVPPDQREALYRLALESALIEEIDGGLPSPIKDQAVDLLSRTWKVSEEQIGPAIKVAMGRVQAFYQNHDRQGEPSLSAKQERSSGGLVLIVVAAIIMAGAFWYFWFR